MTPPPSPGQPQLSEAIAFLQQGQFAAAEAVLLAILKRRPRDFDALHLSGVAAVEAGSGADRRGAWCASRVPVFTRHALKFSWPRSRADDVQMESSERVKMLEKQRYRAGCVNPCEHNTL